MYRVIMLVVVSTGLAMMTLAHAQAKATVTVNVFPGGFNWPSYVAQEKGFFARNGISVVLQPTPNSVAQMTGFRDPERMRRAFIRAFGQPPQSLRRAARAG